MKFLPILFLTLMVSYSSCSQAQKPSQDWANLKHFQEANAALPMPTSDEKRVVFMGNSITESWARIRPEFFEGKAYVNRGFSGHTTPQMLLRFRQDVIDLNPSVVVILAGINDIAGNTGPSTIEMIEDNIISMVQLAMAHDIEVILCSVLPAIDFPWRPGMEPAGKVVALNQLIKQFAEKEGLLYIDYFSAMVNDENGLREDLGEDGVHPNAKGYAIMEPLVEAAIAEALSER